jgi:hypothetical protein
MKIIIAIALLLSVCGVAFAGDAQDFVVNGPGVNNQQVCTESQGVITCR